MPPAPLVPDDSNPPSSSKSPGLVPCLVCGEAVAVAAETCPHCGGDLPQKAFNAGRPSVVCEVCLATNPFAEGAPDGAVCRACRASLAGPYHEKNRVLSLRRQGWGLGCLGVVFGALVGGAMGGAGGAVMGGLLAGLVGWWVGLMRYWVLTAFR